MANAGLKPVAGLLLVLNFCMYVIVAAVGGWAINHAIHTGYFIGSGMALPANFSPIYFPMGNAATGFFVIFAVIAGVVGAAAALAGFHHVRAWSHESLAGGGLLRVHRMDAHPARPWENHGVLHHHTLGNTAVLSARHSRREVEEVCD
ncbi:hypothetical protein OsJ_03144 [Oryza sativa Japonica Group]|uniref:Uncharacterized protein n=1 Tax=Oryza sativa subsp. japonica TaxID=39947 RepID=B9EZ07_ORYSJ|nr:hypothetical protein OsJ_03144 [Oryza sativa Japonica Group]